MTKLELIKKKIESTYKPMKIEDEEKTHEEILDLMELMDEEIECL